MASEMVRPVAVGFLDYMIRDRKATYRFEDVIIPPDSPYIGKSISEIKGTQGGTALVVAIRKGAANEINPPADGRIEAEQNLVVLGTVEQVQALKDKLSA
jgi:voltage-gated potassium channel